MDVEKRVVSWENANAERCHFCGDVFLQDGRKEPDELTKLFHTSEIKYYLVCDNCRENKAEPNFPSDLRPG